MNDVRWFENVSGLKGPLSVVVISMGRPDCLAYLFQALRAQTRPPDRIVFVLTNKADLPADWSVEPSAYPKIIFTQPGTCHQRNVGLEALSQTTGLIAFLDDDYLPAPDALENMERAFKTLGPNIGGMSGHLIADGIAGPGLSHAEAEALIAQFHEAKAPSVEMKILKETIGLYGCNMVLRADAIGPVRFDEKLPLYAWQEDVDFAHRVAQHAGKRMVLTNAFAGVHRGVKSGREKRGVRLGYSQVANNWYLWQQRSLPGHFALRVACRNLIANHLKIWRSEPWLDRRGRARGNRRALRDLLTGRIDPGRIHDL